MELAGIAVDHLDVLELAERLDDMPKRDALAELYEVLVVEQMSRSLGQMA